MNSDINYVMLQPIEVHLRARQNYEEISAFVVGIWKL